MDLKIIEKLFLLLVRSQLLMWKRIEAMNVVDSAAQESEDSLMQESLEEQAKYLEDRIKA